jgi:DNA-binding IclR family transcriptional regulator
VPPSQDKDSFDRYIVPGLQRGLDILQLFARSGGAVAVPDACRALSISRATAFRIFYTLEANGFIFRLPSSNSYRLHSKILTLGFDYLFSLDVAEIARPYLDKLRDAVQATAHLGIRVGTEMYYVLRASTTDQRLTYTTPGKRHPAHAVSSGRALLLDLSDRELDELYQGYDFSGLPDFVPSSLDQLKSVLAVERRQGYVIAQSLSFEAIKHIAVPIRDSSGQSAAAINISDRFFEDEDLLQVVLPQLQDAAESISKNLGYHPAQLHSLP